MSRQCPFDQRDGSAASSPFVRQQTEKVQTIGVSRLGTEHDMIKDRSLFMPVLPMMG